MLRLSTRVCLEKPYIWNTLHNFGGNHGTLGCLEAVSKNFTQALQTSSNLVGVGITMEGIWQNYIVYDLTLSMAWESNADLQSYVNSFALKRYGFPLSSPIQNAYDPSR
eukprot:UN03168